MVKVIGGWLSVSEAAERLGVSRVSVYTMCADGRLVGEKVAGRLAITVESLDRLIAERAQ